MGPRAAGYLALLLTAHLSVGRGDEPGPPGPGIRPAAARMANADGVRRRLGLVPGYERLDQISAIKVAVLDYGFEGAGAGRGHLPASAEIVEHYEPEFVRRFELGDPAYRKGFDPINRHGRVMAQIVWAVTGSHPTGPKFYLLNANGPTMLRRAVRFAIEKRVDIILFSGSFEGGGNGDGGGFINRIVADAVSAGILWINAAGNYGQHVYNGPVRVLPDGYLRLREGSDIASLRFRNWVDENAVTITLTWNDYRDDEDAGTDKDLDLYVEDWSGRVVGASEKVQVTGSKEAGENESRNPRERVLIPNLSAGPEVVTDPNYTYRIRVRARQGRFTSSDRLRIVATAARYSYLPPGRDAPRAAFEFLDATGDAELFPPADSPLVFTVGDADPSSSIGPTLDGRVKPDVILSDSRAYFTDGEVSSGSSDAAAYIAGVAASLRAVSPSLHIGDLQRLGQQGPLVASFAECGRPGRIAQRPPGFHFWQTPSRTRLMETLLGIR